jgi:CBS domain containing-hemolysin-like protein
VTLLPIVWILLLALMVAVCSIVSYLRLLMRRLTPLALLKLLPSNQDGKLRADRERVGVSLSALHGAAMALFAVGLTGLLFLSQPGDLWQDLGAAMVIVLAVIVVCDQFIPFVLVARHDEPDASLRPWVTFLRLSIYAALPITFPILVSTTIRRLLEPSAEEEAQISPQEGLQELIETGEKEGLIQKGEGDLLQSVVEFRDKIARDVMTPRPEIAAIEVNSSVEALRELFRARRYTRYLVCAGQLDNVEGIVSVRDLMELPPEEQSRITLRSLVKPVRFVPETKPIHSLLKELQKSTTQLAIVIDEYGSVAGLVTVEDLVEEIVGEIRDEVEPHAKDIVQESKNSYLLAGNAELAQIADRIQLNFEDGDYSTVAGLLLAKLGHLPIRGEKVAADGLTFEVLDANRRRVLKVRLTVSSSDSHADPAHAGSPSA